MGGGGGWCCFFFFKQKTAYEIGTGDWSSDVCLPISTLPCETQGRVVMGIRLAPSCGAARKQRLIAGMLAGSAIALIPGAALAQDNESVASEDEDRKSVV